MVKVKQQKQIWRLFYREIDAGHGKQFVLTCEGKIVYQYLVANSGYYTGDGNPEWIELRTKDIKHFWRMFKEIKDYSFVDNVIEEYLEHRAR